MTIEEYKKENPDWDISSEWELDFAEADRHNEAVANLEYVLLHHPMDVEAVAIVVRSYYGDTIDWNRI